MAISMFRDNPGMAGIFFAAILSGTLSSVSSGINSLATCFVTDLLIPHQNLIFTHNKGETFYTLATKFVSGPLLKFKYHPYN